jgi:hypothetical protein
MPGECPINYKIKEVIMKRIIAILLIGLMALSFAACGGKPGESGSSETAKPAETQQGESSGDGGGSKETAAPQSSVVLDGSRLGVLQPVKEQDALKINGLVIATGSGHHEYPSAQELLAAGFKTEGLYSEYMIQEWFEIYISTAGNKPVKVIILPNDPAADYTKLTAADLEAASEALSYPVYCDTVEPDPEVYGENEPYALVSAYVHPELEAGPGLYNVFFANGNDICYAVQLNIIPEA